MQADIDDKVVHLRLYGKMAELLTEISPDTYHQYTYIMKGKPTLFLRLCKALYGTLRQVYLFWRLSERLHKWGFLTNPYDLCVANREILESQCAILWHADDLNTVVDICLFEEEAPFTKTRKYMTIWNHS